MTQAQRVPPELKPDLERLARRVRTSTGKEFERRGFTVTLSPYMIVLMRMEGLIDE